MPIRRPRHLRGDRQSAPRAGAANPRRILPEESLQLTEVKGLDLTLRQALEFKYVTAPLKKEDVEKGLIDILHRP